MTATRSLMCLTTDRSWATNKYDSPNRSCRWSIRLKICGSSYTRKSITGSARHTQRELGDVDHRPHPDAEAHGARRQPQRPHDAPRDCRLAATRLPDQRERLTFADAEAHAIDSLHLPDHSAQQATSDRKMLSQV